MSEPAGVSIRLVQCGKTFADGTRAVEPLDLEVRAGETMVFLGPSGCGKTTTLRLIAGLETPDPDGRVFFGALDVTGVPIERRNVGMVFQSYALFPNLTAAGNIAYGLRVRRLPAVQVAERVEEMLSMMKIGELRHRPVDQLSGGQRQRVALARALAVRPRVLLLDEPLTALDAKLRDGLRVEIDALLRRLGMTAVYVTHDQTEAMALGDRIVVMHQGQVAQVGRPREIYFSPASRFVADFVGTMNSLRGVARDGFLDAQGGRIPWRGRGTGEIEVLFRPESVTIVGAGAGLLKGRVQAALFMGDRTRLVVEGVGSAPIIVETTARREFHVGQDVHLTIDREALLELER
ncbi:MAG TPA: ABC transporter ATP-binding protein [Candidatus Methylomirabilis sp.]|nr:ABC transporter ATP-binding protein [Candidatus Methylomirabilis sp.]